MVVRLVGVQDVILTNPHKKVAWANVFDAVSGRDDPTVGKKRSSTLVLELASLVLPQ